MTVFENKKNGRNIVFNTKFENKLKRNQDINNHSYVRYLIADIFNKRIYAKLFGNMSQRKFMTADLIARRTEITRDMLGEIRQEYGIQAVKYLNQYL